MNRLSSPEEMERLRESIIRGRDPEKRCVVICGGTGCVALLSDNVIEAFLECLLMDIVLILSDTDRFCVDLDQFGLGIL